MLIYPFILLDVLGGLTLLFGIKYLSLIFGILLLIKAFMTIIPSFKSGFFFEFMGFTDLFGGLSLLLLSKGLLFNWYVLVAVALLSKGFFSFLTAR